MGLCCVQKTSLPFKILNRLVFVARSMVFLVSSFFNVNFTFSPMQYGMERFSSATTKMPANKQWTECTKSTNFIFSLAAVAPLWKRLMVWHRWCLCYCMFAYTFIYTQEIHAHSPWYTNHYVFGMYSTTLRFVCFKLYAIRRALHFISQRYLLYIENVSSNSIQSMSKNHNGDVMPAAFQIADTFWSVLCNETCAPLSIAHLFDRFIWVFVVNVLASI